MKKKSTLTRTFWNLWVTYASFYFGRVNLSIIIPVLLATYPDMTLYSVGFVTSGFLAAYALGQFLHGQLSERFNPFNYIIVGLLGSAVMNLTLGFSAGFFWMLFISEVIDGGFQSMGWSSIVRANAYTSKDPEKSSTVLGTSYQVGNSLAWVTSGLVIGQFGWEWGFWLASIVMFIRAITLYLTKPEFKFKPKELKERIKLTISYPITLSAISLCLLNMVRFGIISWIPLYLYQVQSLPIEKVGLKIFLIPMAGVLGTLLYNRLRLPKELLTIIYLAILGLSFLVLPGTSGLLMLTILVIGGFFLYGPHVFLVTTMPSRFHKESIVAAATGFINGWGYVGSVTIGLLVPLILDLTNNWNIIFYFWSGVSFTIVAIITTMYLKGKRING